MKFYDKVIFKKSETLGVSLTILFIFIFGFFVGYFISKSDLQDIISKQKSRLYEQYVLIDALNETIHRNNLEKRQVYTND